MRHLTLPLALVALLLGLANFASAATQTVCSLDNQETTLGTWTIESFYEPGTTNPVMVDLTLTDADPGTVFEVFNGSSWSAASKGSTYAGTKFRVRNGSSTTTLAHSGCFEEIQTDD